MSSLGLSSYRKTAHDLSQLQLANYFSTKRLKSRPTTNSVCWSNLLMTLCTLQSQIIVLISLNHIYIWETYYEPLARILAWNGENLIFLTANWWPVKVIIGDSIVDLRSQSLIVPSVEADAMKFSYLLKSQERISFWWAWIFLTSFPVRMSHILKVWSPLQDPKMLSWVGCHTA